MYYSLYAFLVVFITGSIVSVIVEKANLVKIKPLDKRYYVSFSFKKNKIDPDLIIISPVVKVDKKPKEPLPQNFIDEFN